MRSSLEEWFGIVNNPYSFPNATSSAVHGKRPSSLLHRLMPFSQKTHNAQVTNFANKRLALLGLNVVKDLKSSEFAAVYRAAVNNAF
jgi:hypothetical protein